MYIAPGYRLMGTSPEYIMVLYKLMGTNVTNSSGFYLNIPKANKTPQKAPAKGDLLPSERKLM